MLPLDSLTQSAHEAVKAWLALEGEMPQAIGEALQDLLAREAWDELDKRFGSELALGTAGMRGRTQGWTAAQGEMSGGVPVEPAVGSGMLNDLTVVKAGIAYYRAMAQGGDVVLVVGRDGRYFSERFSDLLSELWEQMGAQLLVFSEAVSTPELSYAVKNLGAQGGVMITASHNPAHDNGLKFYGGDGGQLRGAVADRMMEAFGQVSWKEAAAALGALTRKGAGDAIDEVIDGAYEHYLREWIGNSVEGESTTAYTALHGVGKRSLSGLDAENKWGVTFFEEECVLDSAFGELITPNPESVDAFMGVSAFAEHKGLEVVIASDPDADRLSMMYRDSGAWVKLSGNELGVMLLAYRLEDMKQRGALKCGKGRVFKSLVTSRMVNAIAQDYGVSVVDTLTGVKWFAEKMVRYGQADEVVQPGELWAQVKRRGKHDKWMIMGLEESCGYVFSSVVPEKDAHAAVMVTQQLLQWLNTQGKTIGEFRKALYEKYGVYQEGAHSIQLEGVNGTAQREQLFRSYQEECLALGNLVRTLNYTEGQHLDQEGDELPNHAMVVFEYEDGVRVAVRPSGTEPKLKYYIYIEPMEEACEIDAKNKVSAVKKALASDAQKRLERIQG